MRSFGEIKVKIMISRMNVTIKFKIIELILCICDFYTYRTYFAYLRNLCFREMRYFSKYRSFLTQTQEKKHIFHKSYSISFSHVFLHQSSFLFTFLPNNCLSSFANFLSFTPRRDNQPFFLSANGVSSIINDLTKTLNRISHHFSPFFYDLCPISLFVSK